MPDQLVARGASRQGHLPHTTYPSECTLVCTGGDPRSEAAHHGRRNRGSGLCAFESLVPTSAPPTKPSPTLITTPLHERRQPRAHAGPQRRPSYVRHRPTLAAYAGRVALIQFGQRPSVRPLVKCRVCHIRWRLHGSSTRLGDGGDASCPRAAFGVFDDHEGGCTSLCHTLRPWCASLTQPPLLRSAHSQLLSSPPCRRHAVGLLSDGVGSKAGPAIRRPR